MKDNQDFLLGASEIPKPVDFATTDLPHQNQAVAEINQREIPPSPSNAVLTWFPLSCLVIYAVISTILIIYENIRVFRLNYAL
jgi:hypothetical protein